MAIGTSSEIAPAVPYVGEPNHVARTAGAFVRRTPVPLLQALLRRTPLAGLPIAAPKIES